MDHSNKNGKAQAENPHARAKKFVAWGLGVLDVMPDGTKTPGRTFTPYLSRRPTDDELQEWFGEFQHDVGILGGTISGNLGLLDFDEKHERGIFDRWKSLLPSDLVARLPIIKTPSGGYHAYFRADESVKSADLARTEEKKELIGLRGEGKYVVGPGPAANGNYEHVSGPYLDAIPVLNRGEADKLISVARSLNRYTPPPLKEGGHNEARERLAIADTLPLDVKIKQARIYLDTCPGSESGKQARAYAFALANKLLYDFALPPDDAFELLFEWGQRGVDGAGLPYPWRAGEIWDKIRSAERADPRVLIGCRLRWDADLDARAAEAVKEAPEPVRASQQGDYKKTGQEEIKAAGDAMMDALSEALGKKMKRQEPQPAAKPYRFNPISSADFAVAKYGIEWLIKRLLVKGQAAVVGGPKKALKTSTLIDLVLSLGSGEHFLGHFPVARPCVTALISGESGEATLQETAFRVCLAKGIRLEDTNCYWDFRLPQLSVTAELDELSKGLAARKIEVAVIDPLYLCLLKGAAEGSGKSASNLFDMGPLLSDVSRACLDAGTTPVLVHHAKKYSTNPGEPLDLEDLAFAGVQEFARQWLLLSRRQPYRHGSGVHQLWLSAGGSAGHSGLWGLDINEGVLGEDFTGRTWDVQVLNMEEVKAASLAQKEKKEEEKESDLDKKLLAVLDGWDYAKDGDPVKTKVRTALGWYLGKFNRVVTRLVGGEVLREVKVTVQSGNGATKTAEAIRRKGT